MGSSRRILIILLTLTISVGSIISGSLIFFDVLSENSFPQGDKEDGERYIIQGEVHYNFPNEMGDDGYNESLNFTYVPYSIGEGWEDIYHVEGDVRDEISGGDLILLETTWDEGAEYQIWKYSHYSPPHLSFSLSLFLVLVGLFLIFIPFLLFFKVKIRIGPVLNLLWPLGLMFPGYYLGVVTYDLCIGLITGSILITLVPLLILNYFIMKGSEKKPNYSFLNILTIGPISFLFGFNSGLFLSTMYINYFP